MSAMQDMTKGGAAGHLLRYAVPLMLCLLDNMVRIICLIDINCNAERRVCQLGNCINDQSVILFTVI